MALEIRVPELGESIVDAVIANWLKHGGDTVKKGDTLVELETDKVNVEVSAEESGVLQKIITREGDEVRVGDVLGRIGESVEVAAGTRAESTDEQVKRNGQSASTGQEQPVPLTTDGQRPVSPLARRIAADYNVDLSQVKGNSPHGRVTRDDVISYMEKTSEQQAPAASTVTVPEPGSSAAVPSPVKEVTPVPVVPKPSLQPEPRDREERIRMSRRRQTIAQRLVEPQHTAPILTYFDDIEREIAELAKRARENTLTLADLQGGTFTITNGGVYGSLLSTPILNAPQVGILGMHKIEQRPIVVDGQITIRPMMYVALSYDHRIVDGQEAGKFLVRVKKLVEDPETLLLEG